MNLTPYTIESFDEETTCDYCGMDLLKGDEVLETEGTNYVFCSERCANDYAAWNENV